MTASYRLPEQDMDLPKEKEGKREMKEEVMLKLNKLNAIHKKMLKNYIDKNCHSIYNHKQTQEATILQCSQVTMPLATQ